MQTKRAAVKVSKPWKNNLSAFPMLGKRSLVIGVITTFSAATMVLKLRQRPFDLVEWRLDLTGLGAGRGRWLERCHALEQAGIRVLLTIRSAAEGGHWSGDETERFTLYQRGLAVVSMVDIEINDRLLPRIVAAAHEAGKPVIGSYHDFAVTQPGAILKNIIAVGWKSGADIVKLATRLKTEKDLSRLLALLQSSQPQRPLCIIGMGAPEARLALARAGSCCAYGFLGRSAAPGQISCAELWRQLQNPADERQ
jgi:3-dehydroquinate dehydratase-1